MNKRLVSHPILPIPSKESVEFFFDGKKYSAQKGEVISSALFGEGIRIFGYHSKDNSAMGLFCANGQCSQCTVIADGIPVKACITELKPGMQIETCKGTPTLKNTDSHAVHVSKHKEPPTIKTEVAIIGGGPAGLNAAIEFAKLGIPSIIMDDKDRLGGKLVLQTHTFFGSMEDCQAGTRGIDIATKLSEEVNNLKEINVMLNTQVLAVFSDGKIGAVKDDIYYLIEPKVILVAAGAREKALTFKGCELPGVYGAGAFQTLVNRDLIKAGDKIFIIGGGNVGLIAAYHALQAGIQVSGLIEALPKVSGYKVHKDKILRLGVPIMLSHTILSANGSEDKKSVKSVTICEVDKNFKPIARTDKTLDCDTVLIAAGLNSCNEFYKQANQFGLKAYMAGDAEEIAEASAAMFSGKITALKIAKELGHDVSISREFYSKMDILKSRPGNVYNRTRFDKPTKSKIYPIFHCTEEIPCNPCITICPKHHIKLTNETATLMDLPYFDGEDCSGCGKCVAICPGLAITLVDRRKTDDSHVHLTLAYELEPKFKTGNIVMAVDIEGKFLEEAEVVDISTRKWQDRKHLVKILVSHEHATLVAGIHEKESYLEKSYHVPYEINKGENIVCRCERVTDNEIRNLIRQGITDMNSLKISRCMMGACGGKTCSTLIKRIYQEEGYKLEDVKDNTLRPINAEIKLGTFACVEGDEKEPEYESDL